LLHWEALKRVCVGAVTVKTTGTDVTLVTSVVIGPIV